MEILNYEITLDDAKALWVFAYGSLCWKPGFQFRKAVPGHVSGFVRRFWQGNTTHRGTDEQPGRVATLVEDSQGSVYGVAYALNGEDSIAYLAQRECKLGGYVSHFIDFYPISSSSSSSSLVTSICSSLKVLVYVATSKNVLWQGDANINTMAEQILNSSGASGHNVEYVLRLANFSRSIFPNYDDPHLYELERAILIMLKTKRISMAKLMGDGNGCIHFIKLKSTTSSTDVHQPNINNNMAPRNIRNSLHQHTSRISQNKLRCLNI